MASQVALSTEEGVRMRRKAIVAAAIGTSIEWYDFFLYGSAAALVLNQQFFPNVDPTSGTLIAFGTNFVGFIAHHPALLLLVASRRSAPPRSGRCGS